MESGRSRSFAGYSRPVSAGDRGSTGGARLNQDEAPYFDSLKRYVEEQNLTFHVPGHQHGTGAPPEFASLLRTHGLACDITEVAGIDDIHAPHDQCLKAQRLASELYGAEQCYFLVNGSTAGIQAMFLATLGPDDTVLLPQNSHRSAYAALLLCGAGAHAFPTRIHPEFLCAMPPTAEEVRRAHRECPQARALFYTSPTYHGGRAQTEEIVETARELGLLLLVDEAWGSHLISGSAAGAGADLVVQSFHKMTPALTQGAVLHLNGKRVEKHRLETTLRHLQTSSPSSLIVAAIDCARRYLALHGEESLRSLSHLSRRLTATGHCHTLDDPCKVLITVPGYTGHQLARTLRYDHHIQVEMSEPHQALIVLTPGHTHDQVNRLLVALEKLPAKPPLDFTGLKKSYLNLQHSEPPALTVREVFFSPTRTISLEKSVDRISAELLYCYPPGVPLVYPGERFTEGKVDHIKTQRRLGGSVQGGTDPTLKTVLIVKDEDD